MAKFKGIVANQLLQLAVRAEELEMLFKKGNDQLKYMDEVKQILVMQENMETTMIKMIEKIKNKEYNRRDI